MGGKGKADGYWQASQVSGFSRAQAAAVALLLIVALLFSAPVPTAPLATLRFIAPLPLMLPLALPLPFIAPLPLAPVVVWFILVAALERR